MFHERIKEKNHLTCVPENDMQIPVGVKVGFTEEEQGQLRLAKRLLPHLAAGFAVARPANKATIDMRLEVFMLVELKASERRKRFWEDCNAGRGR